jgi:hypothetical protein
VQVGVVVLGQNIIHCTRSKTFFHPYQFTLVGVVHNVIHPLSVFVIFHRDRLSVIVIEKQLFRTIKYQILKSGEAPLLIA